MWHCNRKVQTEGDRCYQHGNHQEGTAAAEFNGTNPVGTPVRFWPGAREGVGRESVTSSPAWVMGGHSAMVSVHDYPGGIALTHVEVVVPCADCGGGGVCGSPPDQFYDCPTCTGVPVDIQDTKGWSE